MFGLFSKGKMEIKLTNYNYRPGEVIEGTLAFKLKKPYEINAVNIRLYGEVRTTTMRSGKTNTSYERVFDFSQPLEGPKSLIQNTQYEYPFKINVPGDVLSKPQMPQGAVGAVLNTLQYMARTATNIRWYVEGRVDIPKAIDMTKKVQVNIG